MILISPLQSETITYRDLLQKAEPEQVQALEEVSHFLTLSPDTQFRPLQGGLTRAKLYSFQHGGASYVLRFLALGPNHSQNMRQNEIRALTIGNKLGIAPPCTFADPNAVLMVMPFVEGQTLYKPNDAQLSQLGEMIRTLHNFSEAYPTRYTFKERLGLHYQKGVKAGMAYPTGFDREVQNVLNKPCSRPLVPSHGDLNPTNILMSAKGLTLIDWTNGTLDDPFADISFFCVLSHLSPQQEAVFLDSYFGRPATAEELQILREEKAKVYLLTATIWFRFSETAIEQAVPMTQRIAALNNELNSPSLKPAQDYLDSGTVVDLNTAPKSEIRSYALSFYLAYLQAKTDAVQQELLSLCQADQAARFRVIDAGVKNPNKELGEIITQIDAKHNPRLKEIISEYGWPGNKLVGEEASAAMWLLVQHQDQDLPFQKECLSLLETAVDSGTASAMHFALLKDRVCKNEGLPQIYGTQWTQKDGKIALYSVENIATLNERRAQVGLESIEESKETMRKGYHLSLEDFE